MARQDALSADLLLINGRVLTMDAHDSVVQAVAVQDGKIVVLGDDALTFAPERFRELPVGVTIAGGKVVHTGAVRTAVSVPAVGVAGSCSCVLQWRHQASG